MQCNLQRRTLSYQKQLYNVIKQWNKKNTNLYTNISGKMFAA